MCVLCCAAETAITIDDVVVVVNSGRLKEKSYDPYTNVSTLMVRVRVGARGWVCSVWRDPPAAGRLCVFGASSPQSPVAALTQTPLYTL